MTSQGKHDSSKYDTTKTSDSQVNSHFPYRRSSVILTLNIYLYPIPPQTVFGGGILFDDVLSSFRPFDHNKLNLLMSSMKLDEYVDLR